MKDSEQKKAKNLYNCHQCGNTIVTEDIDEDDDDFEDETEFSDVFEKAEETQQWLDGEHNDDLFDDYSAIN